METAIIQSPLGTIKIIGDATGIHAISTMDKNVPVTPAIPTPLQACVTQLQDYFNGTLTQFTFKLNPQGTNFQKKVWQQLLTIPYGTTMSYAQLAKQLGDIKAIRAVAAANGKNPLWIVVPCHRVIGSNGELTGYAGGLWRKKWLLEHESPVKQQQLF